MAMTKIKGLQMWCRKMTDGYPNVDIANFTTAWRDGLAFCAIIHRFRPDLIDFDSLSAENVLYNNKLAFEVAEAELGIPAFLEADDMARLKVPDKLSVITYVSQYYNFLNPLPQLGGPGVKGAGPKKTTSISGVKRAPADDGSHAPSTKKTIKSSISPTAEALKQENASPPKQTSAGDKCGICQKKVYLLERHMEDGKLYHRSCFRHSELSPTNRVFTKSPFMSPNLSTEKIAQENHVQKRPDKGTPLSSVSPRQGENIRGVNDVPMSKDTAKSNLSSILQRVEGGKKKHSINASEGEKEPKKSKLQPKSLFENKESNKKSEPKTAPDTSSMMPLSSMEARRLEKRKQEIIDREKSHKTNIGAKRNVPLVFQQGDKRSTPSSSTSSSSLSTPTTSVNSTAKTTTTQSSGKEPVTSKSGTTGLNSKKDFSTKVELRSAKDRTGESVSIDSSADIALRKQSAPNILSLQQKFSSGNNESKTPVAKPRISAIKETPSKSSSSVTSSRSESNSNVPLRSQDNFPKPAPRRSVVVETKSNKVPPERPKQSPGAKLLSPQESSSSADEKSSTPRSSGSASPPPLPSCPPPRLPPGQSPSSQTPTESPRQPPPLPSSLPPSLPPKDPSSTHTSTTTKSSSTFTESTALSSSISTSPSQSSSSSAGRPPKNPASSNKEPVSKALRPQEISVSLATDKEPSVAVLVTPTTKENEGIVLSGLLTSLAGIRGRSTSTPVVTEVPLTVISTSSTSTSSSNTSASTYTTSSSRKQSEPAVPTSSKLSISTAITTHQNKDKSVSNIAGIHLKPSVSTTPSTKVTNTVAPSSKANQPEKPSEVHSVLSSLKPVPTSDAKTSKYSSSSTVSSGMNENMKARTQSDPKPLSDIKTKTEAKEDKKAGTPSSTKDNSAFFKDVHLKRVMPEQKTKEGSGTSSAPAFNIALKKVESSSSGINNKDVPKESLVEKANEKHEPKASESKQLSTLNQDARVISDEIPQWKKDIEERKRKLREDIARAEAKTPTSYAKHKKERPKSVDILSLTSGSKENELDSLSSVVESPRSDSSTSSVSSSSSSKRRPRSLIESDSNKDSKLDWQLEAEKKIAAFALFDSSEDDIKPIALKTKGTESREALQESTTQNRKEDLRKNNNFSTNVKATDSSAPKKVEVPGNQKPLDQGKYNLKKNNFTEAKHHQIKDAETMKSKIELSAVDIDISGEGGIRKDDKEIVIQDGKRDDKVLPIDKNKKNKTNETTESKPSPKKAENKESLDTLSTPDVESESITEAASNIGSLDQKTKDAASSLPQQEMDKYAKENHEQDRTSSPKLKRKITFLGKADSHSSSPQPMRKITVDRDFNFDSNSLTSSEFEASITQPTAEIRLHDRESPPPRPSSPPRRPPRPKSQRNKTQSPQQISAIELQQQLMEIDNRLTDLELRGRDLEDSIRTVNIQEEDDEEMMIQWFSLVREKNDLVRQEADLVYLSREQDLEGEQQHIDAQLRYLISKEECSKSPQEKEEESYLLQRKIDIVNQRSSIVDSMDEDRLRYEEEDRNIDEVLLEKGLTRNASGTLVARKGLKVAKSTFYT